MNENHDDEIMIIRIEINVNPLGDVYLCFSWRT